MINFDGCHHEECRRDHNVEHDLHVPDGNTKKKRQTHSEIEEKKKEGKEKTTEEENQEEKTQEEEKEEENNTELVNDFPEPDPTLKTPTKIIDDDYEGMSKELRLTNFYARLNKYNKYQEQKESVIKELDEAKNNALQKFEENAQKNHMIRKNITFEVLQTRNGINSRQNMTSKMWYLHQKEESHYQNTFL